MTHRFLLFTLTAFTIFTAGPAEAASLRKWCQSILAWPVKALQKGNKMTADQVIQALNLKPLPGEGGYFSETYRAAYTTQNVNVPSGQLANRSAATAIYYMVTPDTFSALHRLPQDEVFHFYLGEPAELFVIFPDGRHQIFVLGDDIQKGQRPQVVVPAGSWQGTRLRQGSGAFALLGTTVAPGFEFVDMEMGKRSELLSKYPDKRDLIIRYTVGE